MNPSTAEAAQQAASRAIRVVLVDDHKLFRTGVRAELDEAGGGVVEVIGEAPDAPSAVAVIAQLRPEVVLLDGIGHLPMEEAPDATAAAIADFLTRRLSVPTEHPGTH